MIMKQHRFLFLMVTILLSALISYGLFTLPFPKSIQEEGFSSARVVKDLEVIAKEPHSIVHPKERAEVLLYLTERLEELGGNTRTYVYPNITARKFTFDATNLLAEFPPLKSSSDTTYLMMMAHYDSRYPWKLINDTVTSKGASDDGYGLGVILECVHQVLKYRESWNQGIKVLFTDAEEVDLQGMKAAYKNNKEIFNDVGLILNIESRGPFGPVLLFETSPRNEQLVKLYANHARYPFAYSIMNMVYQKMPNGTDMNIVRDSIPGFNFSPIADINHYHTDLDNIHNISKTTIQHYGEQVVPIIKEYLTNTIYAEEEYLKAEDDLIYFSIPLLGMYHFTKNQYWLLNIGLCFLLLHLLMKDKNFYWKKSIRQSGIMFAVSLVLIAIGEIIAWLSSLLTGAYFQLFGSISGIPFDNAVILISILSLVIGMILYDRKHTNTMQNLTNALILLMIIGLAFQAILGENMMFFIPACIGTITLFLWKITSSRIFPLIGMAILLLHAFSFVYILAMGLTIGALGIILLIAFYNLIVIIPLANGYLTDKVPNQKL